MSFLSVIWFQIFWQQQTFLTFAACFRAHISLSFCSKRDFNPSKLAGSICNRNRSDWNYTDNNLQSNAWLIINKQTFTGCLGSKLAERNCWLSQNAFDAVYTNGWKYKQIFQPQTDFGFNVHNFHVRPNSYGCFWSTTPCKNDSVRILTSKISNHQWSIKIPRQCALKMQKKKNKNKSVSRKNSLKSNTDLGTLICTFDFLIAKKWNLPWPKHSIML